jgi:phosphate-selective porin OprO/OprP
MRRAVRAFFRKTLSSAIITGLALAAPATALAGDSGWHTNWKDGINWKSDDGQHSIRLGGRILGDFAAVSEDTNLKNAIGGEGTGVEFRAARIFIQGTAYKRLAWKAQYDFASGSVKDLWIALKKVPHLGTVKFGHFKEPFSLQQLTSLRFITFMERALPAAFDPSRNTGIQFNNSLFDKRATWAIGAFREMDADFGETKGFSDSSGYQITARASGAPIYQDGGAKLLHVGLGYSHKFREIGGGEDVRWKSRPESHLAPTIADSGKLDSKGANLLNIEAAAVAGPLSLQAEYTSAWTELATGTSRSWGAYVEASYFITGEHRHYVLGKGVFGRNKIRKNLNEGWGAWQIAARFSRLEVQNEDGLNTGDVRDITLGLNWYLYSNFRIMANYIYSDVNNSPYYVEVGTPPVETLFRANGNANIFQMRAQVDF